MNTPEVFKLDETQIARTVLAERIKVFTDRTVASATTSPLGTILLAWLQAPVTGWERAVLWLCLINLAELLIIGIGYRIRSVQTRGEDALPWARWMISAVFLAGLVWGSTVWFFWAEGQYLYYMLNLLVLVGVVGIDVVIMSPFRMAITLFTGGTLLLPLLHLVMVSNPFSMEIAAGLTILFVLVIQHGRAAEKQLIGGLENAVRNKALAGELAHRTVALEATQAELNRAQAVAHVGSWVYDLVTDSIQLSAETCRIFGVPEGTKSRYDIYLSRVHPKDRSDVDSAWKEALKGRKPFDCEHRILVDKNTRWVRQRLELEFSAEGKPQRGVGTSQDITERKKAEEALKESESTLREAQKVGHTGSYAFDIPGDAWRSSAVLDEIFGIGADYPRTLAGWTQILHPVEREQMNSYFREILAEHRRFEREYRIVRKKDGAQRWVLGLGEIEYGADGTAVRMAGVIQDITERKQAEVQRAQLEAQLRESQKMEALGNLAGGVAHDFNNALAAILGNLELARQDVGPGHPALVSLEEIGKASRRAKDLVQQILAFGRRQTLNREATSLSLVVVESARLIRTTLPAGVSLSVNCRADAPAVLADAAQVKQILLNLCQNAVHAVQGQERAGVIEISLEGRMLGEARGNVRPGRYACLSVRDNGMGMDEATRSHIFEPFFTTKPKGKGTGLGLSVVHGIIQAHGGSIEIDSALGGGSEFRVYFPALDTPVTADTMTAPEPTPLRGDGQHVLYVDDEEAIIFLMTRLLVRRGFLVSGFTDPQEAVAAARANPDRYDIAVTDYNMPGMSGLEVAAALKEIRSDLPVVLASGYITEALRHSAPAAGVRELIYKPDTVEELCEAVARAAHAQSEKSNSS